MNILDFLKEADRLTKGKHRVKARPVLRSAYQIGDLIYSTDSTCMLVMNTGQDLDQEFNQEFRFDNAKPGEQGTYPENITRILEGALKDSKMEVTFRANRENTKAALDLMKAVKGERAELTIGGEVRFTAQLEDKASRIEALASWDVEKNTNPEESDWSFFSADLVLFLLDLLHKETRNVNEFPVQVHWGGKMKPVVFGFSNLMFLMLPLRT